MAVFDAPRSFGSARPVQGRVSRMMTGLVGQVIAWNDARVTRNELLKLSDHELDDLGLCRGDVDEVVGRR